MQTVDLAELKCQLETRIEAVVQHLLPAGRRDGHEWRVGSIQGEPGKSLGVHMTGAKTGIWSDFSTGEKGDLIDLWKATHQVDLPSAIWEVCAWLGIPDDQSTESTQRHVTTTLRPTAPLAINGIHLPDDEARLRFDRIIARTKPLKDSLGSRWLRDVRSLEPYLLDEEAVRFLPSSDRFPPALASVITAWTDSSIVLGLQITALADDGSRKSWRKFITGSKPSGGVCRLIHDAEVTTEITLSEGLETGLAAMTAQHRAGHMVRPVWAAMTAGNFVNLSPLPAIERLMLLVDADDAGRKGAEKCAALWHQAGREVRVAEPTEGADWNDAHD